MKVGFHLIQVPFRQFHYINLDRNLQSTRNITWTRP